MRKIPKRKKIKRLRIRDERLIELIDKLYYKVFLLRLFFIPSLQTKVYSIITEKWVITSYGGHDTKVYKCSPWHADVTEIAVAGSIQIFKVIGYTKELMDLVMIFKLYKQLNLPKENK